VLDPFVLTCERAMLGTSAGSPSSGAEVANLGQRAPPGPSGGIAALGFTRNDAGARVITVGADAAGTIQVWNWRSGALDAQGEAGPNRVLAVAAHPSVNTFVTCGVDHLKLWSFTGRRLDPAAPLLGALGRAQTFCCVEFVFLQYPGFGGDYEQGANGFAGGIVTLVGTADGFVYILEGRHLAKVLSFAHTGPVLALAPAGGDSVVSVGQDGTVKAWNLYEPSPAPAAMLPEDCLIRGLDLRSLLAEHPSVSDSRPASSPARSTAGDSALRLFFVLCSLVV
jgi:hypothetical protein